MQGQHINFKKCLGRNIQAIFMPTIMVLADFSVGFFISDKTIPTGKYSD